MSDDKQTLEAIKTMARLSVMTNQINGIQEKNLKLYPFVFFEGITSAKIEYDLEGKNKKELEYGEKPKAHDFKVIYHLELDEKANNHLEKRFEAIKTAVLGLLWSDIEVEVRFNDRSVYKSKQ